MSLDRLLGTWDITMRHVAMPEPVRCAPDFWQRSTARFVSADLMEGTGENSDDEGSTWQHDYEITYERLGCVLVSLRRC